MKDGKLDKYGKPNEKTPNDWKESYVDYNAAKLAQSVRTKIAVEDAKEEDEVKQETNGVAPMDASPEKKKKKKDKKAAEEPAADEEMKG